MRKTLFFMLVLLAALPLQAAREKHQSYFTYDDGGTIVRQGEDAREIEARVNLPVFPGDEVITNRRGRSEVRLSDGNVMALDRATAVLFRSVLDSYDGDANETVAELRYGQVMVSRTEDGHDDVRLDTKSASYVASAAAIYSVEADTSGKDRVTVFEGAIEVRTPSRSTRLRAGEEAHVDGDGIYGLVSQSREVADDFERWFLRRSERYNRTNSRYLDRSLAYSDSDLGEHGSWSFVAGLGWGWHPYVSVGWRPYYYGRWMNSRSGSLTWVSYEPWGWVPYHYGRWAYDSFAGWVWIPGGGYAPAWVYWMYGPSYIGWAPMGWYDCYRPYYDWAYRPYSHAGAHFGFGFYGRVRVHDVDLRPWTFLDSNTIVSDRVDRAALTTDAIRQRLARNGGSFATVSSTPARFTRDDLRDPAAAVNTIARRSVGSGTGKDGPGSSADMTPFFRRDPELSNSIRDRIVRRPAEGSRTAAGDNGAVSSSGGLAPIGSGNLAPIGRDPVAPITTGEGRVGRDAGSAPAPSSGRIERGGSRDATPAPAPSWRGRTLERPVERQPVEGRAVEPSDRTDRVSQDPTAKWRGRAISRGDVPGDSVREDSGRTREPESRGSDVPRRVIDGIGGARVSRGDEGSRPRESSPPPRASSDDRPRREGSTSPPPKQEPHRDSGSTRQEGGRIKRDH